MDTRASQVPKIGDRYIPIRRNHIQVTLVILEVYPMDQKVLLEFVYHDCIGPDTGPVNMSLSELEKYYRLLNKDEV